MKNRIITYCLVSLLISAVAVFAAVLAVPGPSVIPLPAKMKVESGTFKLGPDTAILIDERSRATGEYLAGRLRPCSGLALPVRTAAKGKNAILLTTKPASALGSAEAYSLKVSSRSVQISASDPGGLFYGIQTLLQLLPAEALSGTSSKAQSWKVPCVKIEDAPRFKWRGLLLDVSRHFFTIAEVERFIDGMAFHKLNRLQLHLSDDQGWRVEIRKYPKLTTVGAWRKGIGFRLDPKASTAYGPDGRYGGFYTQEQIRALVAYAAARHVTIVPEIEMPGHAGAELGAYPDLTCHGKLNSDQIDAPVVAGVYCVGNEETFQFIENVLSEIMELFPGKYIHIGGDEVPKGNWKSCAKCQERKRAEGLKSEQELQSYFVRRVERFINSKGRTLVGWSEIREGGLAENAVVMDWIGGATEAAQSGHDVVMSPNTHCYLDYYQTEDRTTEPHAIGGFLPLDRVYSFEPIPKDLPSELERHILGAQGNIWTEYIPNLKQVEYMAYPRACALAEVGWSSRESRNWDDFKRRLQTHLKRLDALGVNYRKGIP